MEVKRVLGGLLAGLPADAADTDAKRAYITGKIAEIEEEEQKAARTTTAVERTRRGDFDDLDSLTREELVEAYVGQSGILDDICSQLGKLSKASSSPASSPELPQLLAAFEAGHKRLELIGQVFDKRASGQQV